MVYLVDDDADDLEFVQEALLRYNYKGPVLLMTDGKMLIDQLNNAGNDHVRPDVIVLDLNMPLLDGFQALSEIRRSPRYQFTPVIILTASSNKQDEIRCYNLGCNFFINKPARSDEYSTLVSLVKNIIPRRDSV